MFKYRAKRLDNGQWVYGDKIESPEGFFIKENDQCVLFDKPEYHSQGMGCGLEDRCITDRYEAMEHGWNHAVDQCAERYPVFIQIDPATLGVSWGMKDKNGREVFTGDLVKSSNTGIVFVMGFDGRCAKFEGHKHLTILSAVNLHIHEVIGNIHDNIEIIGEE